MRRLVEAAEESEFLLRGSFRCGCFWNCYLHRIGLRPNFFSVGQLQAIHGDLHLPVIHFHEEVVVVDFLALERIVRGAVDGIGVRRPPPETK